MTHNEFCKKIRETHVDENGMTCYPKALGSLQAQISLMMIHLEVFYPDAFSSISDKFFTDKQARNVA